jgi:hypothetical protein
MPYCTRSRSAGRWRTGRRRVPAAEAPVGQRRHRVESKAPCRNRQVFPLAIRGDRR